MKKQKTQSKIIVALTAVVILLVAISATLTFAYFTANASETSDQMTFGKMGISIMDTQGNVANGLDVTDCATTSCTLDNIVPGCLLQPTGSIQIKNNIDTIIRFRMKIQVSGVTGEGANETAVSTLLGQANLVIAAPSANQDVTAGQYAVQAGAAAAAAASGAGYTPYYYIKVAAGAAANFGAVNVFDISRITLQIPTDFGNAYQDASLTLVFEVQAIQAEHLINSSSVAVANPTPAAIKTAMTSAEALALESATAWASATAENNGTDYFAAQP